MISLIAAIGKNNELGKGNALLFNMPADMKYFREKTKGHPVIMGRKTFESIGKALPGRKNIIITRDTKYKKDGTTIVHSLIEALKEAGSKDEVFVIGGAEIYKQAIDYADRLYITHVDATDKKADVFFPEIIPILWNEVERKENKKDKDNPYNYTFSIYEKFI